MSKIVFNLFLLNILNFNSTQIFLKFRYSLSIDSLWPNQLCVFSLKLECKPFVNLSFNCIELLQIVLFFDCCALNMSRHFSLSPFRLLVQCPLSILNFPKQIWTFKSHLLQLMLHLCYSVLWLMKILFIWFHFCFMFLSFLINDIFNLCKSFLVLVY